MDAFVEFYYFVRGVLNATVTNDTKIATISAEWEAIHNKVKKK